MTKEAQLPEPKNWTGGCLCGAIRYECEGDPASVGLCECSRCQVSSGSVGLIGAVWPKESVKIDGALSTYEAYLEPGQGMWRHFCGTCGSSISITLDRFPDIRSMMAGTLDDKRRINPTFVVWHSEGQPWMQLPEKMDVYEDYPDGTFA